MLSTTSYGITAAAVSRMVPYKLGGVGDGGLEKLAIKSLEDFSPFITAVVPYYFENVLCRFASSISKKAVKSSHINALSSIRRRVPRWS